jgi:hypothetical protein
MAVAWLATACATALSISTQAAAAEGEVHRQTSFAPDFYNREVDKYLEYIARMSPENRTKLMQMQDKLMQMEMDQKSAMMKMEMEIAKMRRDMEMFIINSGYPFQK